MLEQFRTMKAYRAEFSAWQQEHDALAPKVGDPSPGFELRDVTGEYHVRLSDFQNEKPVALIFGSFT